MPGMRYQPQGLARINRELPWAADVAFLLLPHRRLSIPHSFRATTGNGSTIATPNGLAYSHTGPGTFQTYDTGDIGNLNGNDFTIIVALDQIGNTRAFRGMIGKRNEGSTDNQWSLFMDSSGRLSFGAGAITRTLGDVDVANRTNAMYAVTGSIADGQIIGYQDGEMTGSAAMPGNVSGAGHSLRLGVIRPGAASENFTGNYRFAAVIRRSLSPAEIRSLYRNLWQAFAEDEDEWAQDSAASYALSAGSAALTVASGQVGMSAARRLPVAPAVLTTYGGSIAVRAARRLRAEPAGLAIAAGPVSVRAARRLAVQSVSLAMLAGPARLMVSRRFGVQPAALAVAGQGTTMRANRRLPVALVDLMLTGGQVSVRYTPAPSPGAYTLPVSVAAIALANGGIGAHVARRLEALPAVFAVAGGAVRMTYTGEQEDIDAFLVPARHTVVFEGSRRVVTFEGAQRVVAFEGGKRVVSFEGSKRLVEFP